MDLTEKEKWIINYIKDQSKYDHVDMLHEDFVDDFVERFKVKSYNYTIGASKCDSLSRLLGKMFRKGLLIRHIEQVNPILWTDGFPKWIYCYQIYEDLKY